MRPSFYSDMARRHWVICSRRFEKTWWSHFQESNVKWTINIQPSKMRLTGCLKTPSTHFAVTRNQIRQERRAQLHRCESLKSRPHSILIDPEDNHTCNDWNISHCSIVQSKRKLFCRLRNFLGFTVPLQHRKSVKLRFCAWVFRRESSDWWNRNGGEVCPPPPPTSRFAPVKSRVP